MHTPPVIAEVLARAVTGNAVTAPADTDSTRASWLAPGATSAPRLAPAASVIWAKRETHPACLSGPVSAAATGRPVISALPAIVPPTALSAML